MHQPLDIDPPESPPRRMNARGVIIVAVIVAATVAVVIARSL